MSDEPNAFLSEAKRDENGRFIIPPKSPGRPVGSRNKLGEAFLSDMLADWEQHGKAVIETVRAEKPDQYLKVVASILPKDVNVTVRDYDDFSDAELADELAAAAASLRDQLSEAGQADGEAGAAEAGEGQASSVH